MLQTLRFAPCFIQAVLLANMFMLHPNRPFKQHLNGLFVSAAEFLASYVKESVLACLPSQDERCLTVEHERTQPTCLPVWCRPLTEMPIVYQHTVVWCAPDWGSSLMLSRVVSDDVHLSGALGGGALLGTPGGQVCSSLQHYPQIFVLIQILPLPLRSLLFMQRFCSPYCRFVLINAGIVDAYIYWSMLCTTMAAIDTALRSGQMCMSKGPCN
jgi:hypothetical protein